MDFNSSIFYLGKLCPKGHKFNELEQSLRYQNNWCCACCVDERTAAKKKPKETLEQALWRRVNKNGDCWEWQGSKTGKGYGELTYNRKKYAAHRLALILTVGDPPEDKNLACHTCDNPACCNPEHLFWGSSADNTKDMMSKGRHKCDSLKGELTWNAKFTEAKIREIRARYAAGEKQSDLAAAFHTSQGHVTNIVNRKAWSHVL